MGSIIYSNTLNNPFVFDDIGRIKDNEDIRLTEISFLNIWKAAFGPMSATNRPIGNISFALNYCFHNYNLPGYHIINIIIHILSGIFLYFFILYTLNNSLSGTQGNLFFHNGNLEKAIKNYRDALHLNPDNAEAHNNIGSVLTRQGYYKDAMTHFKNALRIKPDYQEAQKNLELALDIIQKNQ